MTPNLLPLYVACFATIGLLAGFARHNQKTGWVRKRKSFFQDLLDLQAFAKDLEGFTEAELANRTPSRSSSPISNGAVASLQEAAQFSSQLAGLNAGLRTGMKSGSPEVRQAEQTVEAEHASV